MKQYFQNAALVAVFLLLVLIVGAYAATIDARVGGNVMPALSGRTYVLEATMGGTTNVYASNDVIHVIGLNSNQVLMGLSYQVVTAITTNASANTLSIGLNADADCLASAIELNAAGGQVWVNAADSNNVAGVAMFTTATNSISVTYGTDVATAGTGFVVRIRALLTDFNL